MERQERICESCGKKFISAYRFICSKCYREYRGEREHLTERDKFTTPIDIAFYDYAVDMGYEPTKRGYPDFICYKDGDFILVECKSKDDKIKESQYRFMKNISQYGVRCLLWKLGVGFVSWEDGKTPLEEKF